MKNLTQAKRGTQSCPGGKESSHTLKGGWERERREISVEQLLGLVEFNEGLLRWGMALPSLLLE